MKIYQVHYRDATSESKGYEYFTSKKLAWKALMENAIEYGILFKPDDEIREVVFERTTKGILGLLARCGSHPDNG